MTLVKHELRQGKTSFLIWSAAIGFLLAICIFLFPEMKGQMDGFNSMGAFSDAFGMDQLDFGTFIGYYAIECGNVLGLGGALFASICSVGILCKEEKDKTAEFLLTLPISCIRIITEKLITILIQIMTMNLFAYAISVCSTAAIGEAIPWKEITLMHFAYFFLQIELAGICFGVSAFISKSSIGIGIGIAIILYFLNLIANIADIAEFLKYITPFGFCEGAYIVTNVKLDAVKITIGMAICALSITTAYLKYSKKDIR